MTTEQPSKSSKIADFIKTAFQVVIATPFHWLVATAKKTRVWLSYMYAYWHPPRLKPWQKTGIVFMLEIVYWAVVMAIILAVIALLTFNPMGAFSALAALILVLIVVVAVAVVVGVYSTYGAIGGTIALFALIIILAIIGAILS